MPRYVVENRTVQLLGSLAKHNYISSINSFFMKNTAIIYNTCKPVVELQIMLSGIVAEKLCVDNQSSN